MKKMKSNAPRGNIFSEVVSVSTPQARFDLSYYNKLTCNHGVLIPFLNQEIVPGDKFNVASLALVRLQPLVAPSMQDIDIEMRYFYVPYRLVWDNFEEFMTGNTKTGAADTHVHPHIVGNNTTTSVMGPGSLADYLGLFPNRSSYLSGQGAATQKFSSLPFRAYHLIWNEYFRDENLETEMPISHSDGADNTNILALQHVSLKKDYFTSALPFAQKGDASVIAGDVFLKSAVVNAAGKNWPSFKTIGTDYNEISGRPTLQVQDQGLPLGGASNALEAYYSASKSEMPVYIDPNGSLGTLTSINELRRANAVQRFLERSAVAGSRYSEWLLGHFGVRCADSRLQRPEYLGGGRCPIVMSEIAQTSAAQLNTSGEVVTNATPQGTLAGKGSASPMCSFTKPFFFPEFGILMGLLYIRPRATYCQGINRKWSRMNRFDYYMPEFAYLGEQEVLKKEIYDHVSDGHNDETFGYQSRYAEYKFNYDELHGDFRSSLKFWTMPREFASRPSLNSSFIDAYSMPYNIFAVTDAGTHHYLIELFNKIDCVRPMPKLFTSKL